MTVHPIDSDVFGNLFGTEAMRAVFGDDARLQRLLDVEAALARAQGGLGVIPAAAAKEIGAKADLARIDRAAIREGTELAGYPIVALVQALAAACSDGAGRYVHWGATTQDIVDTGLVLQIRDGLALLDQDLTELCATLATLAAQHRATVMAGRTHLQHALPITFGLKCATWLAPLQRHQIRLAELRPRVLMLQFGGAVGTLASLGVDGLKVVDALAAELDLEAPKVAWHTARDSLAEVAGFLGVLTGTLGKIATDVSLLMQSEVGEAFEPHIAGRGGSSTMPQKRNPIACEFILAAARNVHALVPAMLGAMLQDHERATGPWHAEWLALPPMFVLTAGALRHACAMLGGLTVDALRMQRNLEATGGLIMAEAVMMALAGTMGRGEAHHVVQEACDRALRDGRSLHEVLAADPRVTTHIDAAGLADVMDPARYVGLAGELVDRVLD